MEMFGIFGYQTIRSQLAILIRPKTDEWLERLPHPPKLTRMSLIGTVYRKSANLTK
jgi:hypothetical protein